MGNVVVWSHLARLKPARWRLAWSKLAPVMLAAIHMESRIMARVKSAPLMLHRVRSAPFTLVETRKVPVRSALRRSASIMLDWLK